MQSNFIRRNRFRAYFVVSIASLSIVSVVYYYFGVINASVYTKASEANLKGDSFGMVNALFSGLALAGVILALLIQTAEFHLSEMERQDGIQVQQTISRQSLLTSFATATDTWIRFAARKNLSKADRESETRFLMAANEYRCRKAIEIVIEQFHCEFRNTPLSQDANEILQVRHVQIEEQAVLAEHLIHLVASTTNYVRSCDQPGQNETMIRVNADEMLRMPMYELESLSTFLTGKHELIKKIGLMRETLKSTSTADVRAKMLGNVDEIKESLRALIVEILELVPNNE